MMQLIVLGQIPGTHFQLTFAWFQVLMVPVIFLVAYKVRKVHTSKNAGDVQRHYDVISLRSLDQA
ncbi:MAG: hypothetical protein QG553_804 [Patescibacteria group bacterium]|nr:hypothetical protein [Patescibacteria group bacterium]